MASVQDIVAALTQGPYAGAFGTGSPAEEASRMPNALDHVVQHTMGELAAIPQRAIEGSMGDMANLGSGEPKQSVAPATDAALWMMGGSGAVPAEANTLRSGIKITKAGKDTYNIVDHEGKVLANADIGIVTIDGKRLAQIDDINTPALNSVTTQAEHDAAIAGARNTLGTGHMREAMRQFLEMHPDVEGFTGNRVSGARNAGMMNPDNIQNITVNVPAADMGSLARTR